MDSIRLHHYEGSFSLIRFRLAFYLITAKKERIQTSSQPSKSYKFLLASHPLYSVYHKVPYFVLNAPLPHPLTTKKRNFGFTSPAGNIIPGQYTIRDQTFEPTTTKTSNKPKLHLKTVKIISIFRSAKWPTFVEACTFSKRVKLLLYNFAAKRPAAAVDAPIINGPAKRK